MTSCIVLVSFVVMLWKIETILASGTVFTENFVNKNSSALRTLVSGTVFAENLADNSSSEFHTLTSATISAVVSHENNSSDSYEDYWIGKDESLFDCELFTLEPEEFVIFPNGSAFVPIYNQIYNESFYFLMDDNLRVCRPPQSKDSANDDEELVKKSPISLLSLIGVITSMVCLSIHLIVFSLVPDLQNLPGCNLASLCASLLISYLFMLLGQYREEGDYPILCMIAGILTYFFFLASFLWMFVIAFDVCRSILASRKMRVPSKKFKVKKFAWYNLFSWSTALSFTVAAVVADNADFVPSPFRPMFKKSCWFETSTPLLIFFAVPVGILICLNFFMFGLTAFITVTNRIKSSRESHVHSLKNHLLYFRLTVIMGVTWIIGVVAPLVNVLWLWYVFASLNTLQGLFIFLAFTCTSKVKNFIKRKMSSPRRPSQKTPPLTSSTDLDSRNNY